MSQRDRAECSGPRWKVVQVPDEIEKQPLKPGKPTSGTYGERKEVEDLKASLPPMDSSGAAPGGAGPSPMPTPKPGMPAQPGGRPTNAPSGVPSALLRPTNEPDVPVNTPLGVPAPAQGGAQSAQEARLALLQMLAESDTVSDETRSWAQAVLEMLS